MQVSQEPVMIERKMDPVWTSVKGLLFNGAIVNMLFNTFVQCILQNSTGIWKTDMCYCQVL